MHKLLLRTLALCMSERSADKLLEFVRSLRYDYNQKRIKKIRKELVHQNYPYPYKLNIGCGSNIKNGWINIDLNKPANLILDVREGLPFANNSCEFIYMEHFLEHLAFPEESVPLLRECLRVLRPGCCIRIGVPDSRYVVESCIKDPIDPEWLKKAKIFNWGYPDYCKTGFEFINFHFRFNGKHKFAFDYITLKTQLEREGFVNVQKKSFDPQLDAYVRAEGTLYVTAEK